MANKSLSNRKEGDAAVCAHRLPSGRFSHLALCPGPIPVILESYYFSKEGKRLEPLRTCVCRMQCMSVSAPD